MIRFLFSSLMALGLSVPAFAQDDVAPLAAIGGAQRQETTVRFDEADHAWLTAYTHMLSGVAHIFVAFDPTRAIASVAEGHARIAEAPSVADTFDRAALEGELARIVAELEQVNTAQKESRLERHRLEA